MTRKAITIYDIAREAGVSPATVSRILTGNTAVSEDKRMRVMALIKKYNFRPNAMARALSETRTKLIGMVMADAVNPYYHSVFAACADEAYRRGYMTMMFNTSSRADMEEAALTKLREQRVDAIIVCGGRVDLEEPDPAFIQLLRTTMETTPVVVGSRSPLENVYGVAVDHEGSMDAALDYLLGLGHRDVGFFYAGEPYYGTVQRLKRFRERMAQEGLPVREEWLIRTAGYDNVSGAEAVRQYMALEEKPTALLGMNDMVTAGMLQGLHACGVRVPEDVSVMAFDDTFITTITTPQLTAIDYDYRDYARMLVDTAVGAMENRKMQPNRLVPPSLSIKASCAPIGDKK